MQIEIDSLTRCFHNANKARCCFTVFFLLIYCCTLVCIIISTKESRAGRLAGICWTKSQSPLFPRGGVWLLVIVHTNATCEFFFFLVEISTRRLFVPGAPELEGSTG